MDAKCTDSQWYGGVRGGAGITSSEYHHTTGSGNQQQQQSLMMEEDNNDDDLDSILLPDLHGNSDILLEKHVRELSKCLPARAEGYAWTLAFTTTNMGFSLKSLYRSLSRYEGPVLLIIKDNEHSIFGAFSSCSLKPSESFYGTGETYLFTFKQPKQSAVANSPSPSSATTNIPSTTTTSAIGGSGGIAGTTVSDVTTTTIKSNTTTTTNVINNNNNQLNSNNNNNESFGQQQAAQSRHHFKRFPWTGDNLYFIKGDTDSLAFGAGEGNFGLWLDEDLYHGSTHSCLTFNNEPLAHHEDFVVCTLECWCFL